MQLLRIDQSQIGLHSQIAPLTPLGLEAAPLQQRTFQLGWQICLNFVNNTFLDFFASYCRKNRTI